jgi:HSP20 family molecular chaperone IbpA
MIAGQKTPAPCQHHEAAFHLAERGFGRFARAVRIEGAFDPGRASASLAAGELRISIPRIDDRRGKEIRIPVRT